MNRVQDWKGQGFYYYYYFFKNRIRIESTRVLELDGQIKMEEMCF